MSVSERNPPPPTANSHGCDRLYRALADCHRRIPAGLSRDAACRHLNRSLAECLVAVACPEESDAVRTLCSSGGTALKRRQCQQAQPLRLHRTHFALIFMKYPELQCIWTAVGWTPTAESSETRRRCGGKRWGRRCPQEIPVVFPGRRILAEKRVEETVDGVLGGYGHVNTPDIEGSEAFLNSILAERFPDTVARGTRLVALDCGSGIGRITKNLLIRYFNEVDLLEPVSHFLDTARKNLAPEKLMVTDDYKAVNFFCVPLQEFTPEPERYDIIWIQWCIGHLSDDDFVSFFSRAKGGLKPGGLFVLKENIARSGFVLDKKGKSITRSDLYFKQLFNKCGLHIYKMKDQKGFPDELFAVKMYALTTDMPKKAKSSRSKRHINRPAIIK